MLKKVLRIFIPILGGIIVSLLIMNSMDIYNNLVKPPLSIPSICFPIIWTILYILIGFTYYNYRESNYNKETIILYYFQLLLNYIWPILFFNLNMYIVAVIILLALIILNYILIKDFKSKIFIIYTLWTIFALYLNIGIIILN